MAYNVVVHFESINHTYRNLEKKDEQERRKG